MTRKTTGYLRLLCAVVLVLGGADSANAQTAQAIARKAFGSTVLLVMEDANGQPLSLGSGFFVGAGQIASNLHVVEGAVRGYAKLVGQKTKYDLEGITAVDSRRDLVVLKVAVDDSPVLPLGDSDAVQVGEAVYAVGNPQGLEGTFSEGIVSSIREVGTDRLLQITAPISPGSSGGPVLNGKGEVIGVSVGIFKGGQNLNFAIPVKYLELLLERSSILRPLAEERQRRSERSVLSFLGEDNLRGVVATQFLWEIPYYISSSGYFSLTLRNQLNEPVKNIHLLIVFYRDHDGRFLPVSFEPHAHSAKPLDGSDSGSLVIAHSAKPLEPSLPFPEQ